MKKFTLALAAFVLLIANCPAQDTKTVSRPVPTPVDEDVVKISTNLIQIDVTVVDAKGKIVTDLKPSEIEIFENGQKQNISNFSFVSSVTAPTGKKTAAEKVPIPVPQHTLRPEQVRRTVVLVVDDLRLSFESVAYTRRALTKFVDEQMQDGDLVAVIRTGVSIGTLQQFTADKQMLHAAIDRVRWNPNGNSGIGTFDPNRNAGMTGSSVPAEVSIRAIRDVVEGMTGLPGRKSIFLFSEGFPLYDLDENKMSQSSLVNDSVTKLIDAANRSSVVIYTIDSRGLAFTGPKASDPIVDPQIIQNRRAYLNDTQDGLARLARGTGGFDIKNNNDLSAGVRKILDDQSYYLVGYEPNPMTFEPGKIKFNKLEVRVSRVDTKVRYRGGYESH